MERLISWPTALKSEYQPVFSCSPCVCRGQCAVCGGSDDLEGGAKGVEPPRGELRGASGELKQTSQLFLSEAGHHGPEPLHHLWQQKTNTLRRLDRWTAHCWIKTKRIPTTYFLSEVPRASDYNSVSLKVLYVYITGATHQQLKGLKGKNYNSSVAFERSTDCYYKTSHIPPTHSHQIWLEGFLAPVRSNLQLIRKSHSVCEHYRRSQMKATVIKMSAAVQPFTLPFRKCSTSSLTWLASLYWANKLR